MAVNQGELLEGRPWHTLTAEEVQRQLEAPPGGLTTAEAAARLERYGPNVVEAEKVEAWWRLLLRQFNDPLIFILLIAAAVTAALHDYTDSGVILAVVILNAAIGFVQALRAREAIRGLARLSALQPLPVHQYHHRRRRARRRVAHRLSAGRISHRPAAACRVAAGRGDRKHCHNWR